MFSGWLNFYKNTITKSYNILTIMTVAQMIAAGAIVYLEMSSYWSVLDELDKRIAEDDKKKERSS